jgi:hypothetical protein
MNDLKSSLSAGAITFGVKEAARLIGKNPAWLLKLTQKRFVIPAVAGKIGTGNSTRFSERQLLGLAIGAALNDSVINASLDYVAKVVKLFEEMPESALEGWIGLRRDDYVEEAAAEWIEPVKAWPNPEPANDLAAINTELVADEKARLARVVAAIRRQRELQMIAQMNRMQVTPKGMRRSF